MRIKVTKPQIVMNFLNAYVYINLYERERERPKVVNMELMLRIDSLDVPTIELNIILVSCTYNVSRGVCLSKILNRFVRSQLGWEFVPSSASMTTISPTQSPQIYRIFHKSPYDI